MRRSAPRQTLVLVITALATVLATCVAVAHGDSERDQRHERQLAIAENDLLHATVGPLDRLTDVASTVQGPLSVRRAQFDALAARLLDQKALTSVALARSAGRGAPVRSGADDASTHPQRFKIVYSSSRGKGDPTRDAVQQSAGRTALQGAIRSGDTRSTGVLPAVGGSPPQPRRGRAGARGRLRRRPAPSSPPSRSPAVRAAVGAHLPRRHADRARPGRRRSTGSANPLREARAARRPRLDRRRRAARGAPGPRAGHAAGRRPADDPDRRRRLAVAAAGARRARRHRHAPRRARPRRAGPARGRGALARARRDLHRPDLRARAGRRRPLRVARLPRPARARARGAARPRVHRPRPRGRRRGRGGGARRRARRRRSRSPTGCAAPSGSVWVETRLRVVRDPATRAARRDPRDRPRRRRAHAVRRPRWPRPRSASAPPSRRRRSAWR